MNFELIDGPKGPQAANVNKAEGDVAMAAMPEAAMAAMATAAPSA